MRKSLWILVLSVVLMAAGGAFAKTPDGQTPSQETVCDNESGAAYGLCNAYCEAMDCTDPKQRANNAACAAVKRNFEKKTGRPLPCEATCPCGEMLQLFADITSGAVPVERCVADDSQIFVILESGDYAFIGSGAPGICNVNNEPPFVELTPTETLVCRVALRKAVEAQGVTCSSPE